MKLGWGVPALASAMGVAWATPAAAQQTTHGCACFHNKTTATINYRYRWGDGQWQTYRLRPNYENGGHTIALGSAHRCVTF